MKTMAIVKDVIPSLGSWKKIQIFKESGTLKYDVFKFLFPLFAY